MKDCIEILLLFVAPGITFSDPWRLRRAGLNQTKPALRALHFYFLRLAKQALHAPENDKASLQLGIYLFGGLTLSAEARYRNL